MILLRIIHFSMKTKDLVVPEFLIKFINTYESLFPLQIGNVNNFIDRKKNRYEALYLTQF